MGPGEAVEGEWAASLGNVRGKVPGRQGTCGKGQVWLEKGLLGGHFGGVLEGPEKGPK